MTRGAISGGICSGLSGPCSKESIPRLTTKAASSILHRSTVAFSSLASPCATVSTEHTSTQFWVIWTFFIKISGCRGTTLRSFAGCAGLNGRPIYGPVLIRRAGILPKFADAIGWGRKFSFVDPSSGRFRFEIPVFGESGGVDLGTGRPLSILICWTE